ncbi:MAG: CHAT domain-containing protein [Thermodesulfobacteriota bacterium]|nr:CHAT domain-containing protein [Thermodesulfobacteriota bacterium]
MKPVTSIYISQRPMIVFSSLLLLVFVLLSDSMFHRATAKNLSEELLNRAVQITSRTEAVLDMAISPDGRHIVYVSGDENPTTLWLASADPDVILLPEKLTGGPSVKSSPAISADGRYVAYVDTNFDVKGDIYIIDRQAQDKNPLRLTDRATEDGGPCFSSDSRFLYFHQAEKNRSRGLFVIDLNEMDRRPLPIDTGGDAMFCSISSDNRKLAFVSRKNDPSGDIFILNTENNTLRQLTGGPAIDMFPRWHENNRILYFSRIGSDTNHDNQLTPEDHSVVCRINTDTPRNIPYPMTPLNQVSFKPFAANGSVYFLSGKGGVSNCWALPEEGYIRTAGTAEEQLRAASAIGSRIPYDPYKTLLAWVRGIEKFPDNEAVSAKAGYMAAEIFRELDLLTSARSAYQYVRSTYKQTLPHSVLAEIRQIGIEFQVASETETRASAKQTLLKTGLNRLEQIARNHPGTISASAEIESVTLLLTSDPGLTEMSEALDLLDSVISDDAATDFQKAQALFLQAEIYKKTVTGSQVITTLRDIIVNYPEARKWVDKAVDNVIEHILTHFAYANRNEKIRKLNLTAMENKAAAPPLALGALNRIGDLYYESGDLVQAKAAYENVLATYPVLTTQTAAARLSLAEILFREEQFRAAIDLYEQEISLRKSSDRIYQLARQGYIRKNISAGKFLFRLGEIPSARTLFKELIEYDNRIVEAHRGYIKCASVSGDIQPVLQQYREKLYREKMESNAGDPVWLYCTGLCLTYLGEQDSSLEAKALIKQSIRFNSSIEYFHQTLGYVYEVLETVYGKSGQLERALMSYQKAYFLNDHDNNPENAANLELNLGNSYYLMGQYGKAFDFYSRRAQRDIEFSNPNTEIVFYKRLGESAFQNNAIDGTISAYVHAIELIDSHIDPLAPSRAFDRLNIYLKDTIIAPAGTLEKTKKPAKKTAKKQSEQNLKAADLSSKAASQPSRQWPAYKQKMMLLIDDQESVNTLAVKLTEHYNEAIEDIPGSLKIENARRNLSSLTRQIRQALDFPERLIELKADVSDRLALAYQENRNWEQAAEMFEQVFSINEKTSNLSNLARNRRSVAYNTYQLANSKTGERRIRLLKTAAGYFKQVLSLIELYGVPAPAEKQKKALIDISLSTSLDAASATQAAKGFSRAQEKRLAETFISRIQLELGNLKMSQKELEKQLTNYPFPEAVQEKDYFGVSLLYHRAGLLDNGTGRFAGAFDKFAFSARLCLKLENPVSAATNLKNMASAGQKLIQQPSGEGVSPAQINAMQTLDKKTADLLSRKRAVTGVNLLMTYHNQLGIFYFTAAEQFDSDSLEDSVYMVDLQQRAIGHFTRGISFFETDTLQYQRNLLETATRLYLNMAAAARRLGNEDFAGLNFNNALRLSDTGVFPDLKWRALAGLTLFDQALTVLESVPLARAGCTPGEITESFGSLVFEKFKKKEVAAALNLTAKISELERFNRTAFFVNPQNKQERNFYTRLYPRLEQIEKLQKELSTADADQQAFVQQRLEIETALLADQLGSDNENLPSIIRNIKHKKTRDLAMLLMALDRKIEIQADELAKIRIKLLDDKSDTENNRNLAKEQTRAYQALVSRYHRLAEDACYDRPISSPPDFITLLAAEPFDVMDLTEVMTDDDAVARIFHINDTNSPYAVFLVTKEETAAFVADDIPTLKQRVDETIDWITPYIAYEDPQALDFGIAYPYALSLKHLERSINSRKPFKRKLAAIPATRFSDTVAENYVIRNVIPEKHTTRDTFADLLSGINTLFISNGPSPASTVPTEAGYTARKFFAVFPDNETRVRLESLLSETSNLSLAILNSYRPDPLYLMGHLFSIYGCPAIIFVRNADHQIPLVSGILVSGILESYLQTSGIGALTSAADPSKSIAASDPQAIQPEEIKPSGLIYLGYQGMTENQAALFAKKNFIKYVKTGRSAFDRKEYLPATVMFENAIFVANEVSEYDRYLPDLYKYARESAYLSGNLKQALLFANDLAGLMAEMAPDAKGHAEALLRSGLLYAKQENYKNAIPVIEQAVSSMSRLEADEALAKAFMDLGIVLENATSYQTALSRFKTAADLSRTLKHELLLGEQYLNIGRIYDLRLNQYATAIKTYENALEIFSSTGDIEKTAESKLNIGRCYRLLGNFSKADDYYSQSLELIRSSAPDQLMIKVKILIEQANNAWFQGRYQQAFTLQRQCYTIAKEQKFSLMQVLSLNTEGLIWWTLGDYEKALDSLNTALRDAKRLKIRQDEIASTLNNIGLIYRDRGNYQKALETFEQAIAIDTKIDSKWGLAYDFRNKGLTYLKLDQPEGAADLFDRAYEISTAIGNRINAARAILGKGDALVVLKDFKQAENSYNTALKLSETMMIRETQWRSLFGLAKIQIRFYDNPDAAEKLLQKSIDVIEQLRSEIKVKQLKENFIANKLSVYETLVKLLADKNQPIQSFEIAERSRARNFIDLLGGQQIEFAHSADQKLYNKQQIITSEIETFEKMLAMATDDSERTLYEKSLNSLQHELDNIIVEMQLQNPQLASIVTIPPVNAEKLVRFMEPGTALLSYYLLDNEVFCWILRSDTQIPENRIRLVRIPVDRDILENQILEYRRIIQNIEPCEKHASELYSTLFEPVERFIDGVQTICISPHGSLHYLSFATLYKETSFLVDEYAMFYVPSAAVLEYTLARRMNRPYPAPRVLAVGNPDLGDPMLDIPFAEQEVGSIKWNFPEVTILTGDKATEHWVRNNVSEFDIVHIASHGEFDPVNPLMSAIKLALPKNKNFTNTVFDGNLAAKEIFNLTINADMVFLSACQTGLGKISAGDDVVGLNRSFFFAGTHTVISSLWRVSDVSTAIMIKTFYRLYMNQNKADCLKQAAMHVKTRYPHPGYWGAFTLVGDYY